MQHNKHGQKRTQEVCRHWHGVFVFAEGKKVKKSYLPKAEKDNAFNAHELRKRLVWGQLLGKNMVK
jgi:hypothetical protein